MALLAGWLVFSFLIAGVLAACARDSRRRVAAFVVILAVLIGVPIAALYAGAHQMSIPAYAVILLAAGAAIAAITPNKWARVAALLIIPPFGALLALIFHGLLVSCCAS